MRVKTFPPGDDYLVGLGMNGKVGDGASIVVCAVASGRRSLGTGSAECWPDRERQGSGRGVSDLTGQARGNSHPAFRLRQHAVVTFMRQIAGSPKSEPLSWAIVCVALLRDLTSDPFNPRNA